MAGLSGGIKNAAVEFTTGDYYNANATATDKFTVRKANSTVSVVVDGVDVIATVNEGAIIDIYVNGVHYVCKVDKKGYARLKINLAPKKYKIKAEYKGYITTNNLNVKHVLKAVKKTVTVKQGKKITIKAKLKWSNGKPIKGKKIAFKLKGKTYYGKTNNKGIAKVVIKNKKVLKKLKKGKIRRKNNLCSQIKIRCII